jgi:adenylate cyclase
LGEEGSKLGSAGKELPGGAVTFLFTDIEGSTRLLSELGDRRFSEVLANHRRAMRHAFSSAGGKEVDTQGDALFYVFSDVRAALDAALSAQRVLNSSVKAGEPRLRVRMGIHSGVPVRGGEGYVGVGVHRAARICSAAQGGQILVSQTTADMVEGDLPEGTQLRDLGSYRLKDLRRPERLFQLDAPDLPRKFPPVAAPRARIPSARLVGAILAIVTLFALTGGGWYFTRPSESAATSLAVLPFANFSGDPGQEYLADGLTEALIGTLGQIESLRVISRTSVMQYKDTKRSLPEIAQTLGVENVLEGSIARSGSRVRVTVQLIRAPTDQHSWSQTYERELGDVLLLQSEIARSVAGEIRVRLGPQVEGQLARAHPVQPQAHEAYLKGKFHYAKATVDDLTKSVSYFEQASELQPDYAPAYAALASAYVWQGSGLGLSPKEALPKAKAAALRALALDDSLPDAHTALAWAQLMFDKDWAASESSFKRALRLNPSYVEAHQNYFWLLAALGRHDEALAETKRAQQLDPASPSADSFVGLSLYFARRYDDAIAEYRKALQLEPRSLLTHYFLGFAFAGKGRYEQAMRSFEAALAIEKNGLTLGGVSWSYALAGRREEARVILAQVEELVNEGMHTADDPAVIYIALGDNDSAFLWLNRAIDEYVPGSILMLKVAPWLDPIRSDPRFSLLLQRVRFP